ncbi:peptide chain release factor N(5)-glutamine methyltransferase [Oceaniserpentilla sp. 4NH20-0058]|uniref:peptide chain release factor N(5)-glutamine methyltransferase n=1 Tax=Oceaniserpentilla sp. 4NH20-0058 TaxID=3127660 RepID=UPI0031055999
MPVLNLLPIKQALSMGANELSESDTPALDSELILLHCLNAHRNILFTDPNQLLSIKQQQQFIELIKRRKQGEPVAYIIGEQGFWDLTLNVSPDTLIPRPDTESLIDWVLENNLAPNHILDLGCGTGAIALALAKEFPNVQVLGVDLVESAVLLAKNNQQKNGIANAQFIQSSWFNGIANQHFDLIVSNPPYIDERDEHLSKGDVRYEPSSALIAKQQGFADLFHIAQQAPHFLNTGGCLLMEHGWQQAQGVQTELKRLGYNNVGSGQDLAGQWRFTFGFK